MRQRKGIIIAAVLLLAMSLSCSSIGMFLIEGPSTDTVAPTTNASAVEATRIADSVDDQVVSDTGPDIVVPSATSDSLTLTARFNYTSEDGSDVLPCAGAKVQLWRVNVHDSFVERNGTTDNYGTVHFIGVSAGLVELRVSAWDGKYVEVRDATTSVPMSIYEWSTEEFWVNTTSTIDHLITGDERAAWSAFEAARMGAIWIKNRTGYDMSKVSINWPSGTWPSSSGSVIDVPDGGGHIWNQGTILHEYGHCVHFAIRGGSFPYSEGVDPHYIDSVSNGPFALTEGWAEFFERAVIGDPNRSDTSNLESTVYADGPFYSENSDYGDYDGNIVEGAVANVLWDIMDGVSVTDNPSWDPHGNGDMVDDEFNVFWEIFLNDKPQTMYEVYSSWPDKNDSLRTIFYHARFQIDQGYPLNPTNFHSDHEIMQESDDSTIEVTWSGAIDFSDSIVGYSIIWDGFRDTVPDGSIDTTEARSTSPAFGQGLWYLHVRAIDGEGNAANGSYNIGPFVIAANATDQSTSDVDLSITGWEIAYLAILVIVIIATILMVRKLIKRPEEDKLPPPELQYGTQWGAPPHYGTYNTTYAPPPPPPPASVDTTVPPPNPDGARFCRNCGRSDVGGAFCPFCGYRLR